MKLSNGVAQLLEQGLVVELVPRHRRLPVLVVSAVEVRRGNPHGGVVGLLREILAGGAEKVADADLAEGLLRRFIEHLQKIRVYPVITVHEGQPAAGTVRKGPVDAGIPGGGQTAVLLMDDMDPAVSPGIIFAQLSTVVRAAVIHQNQFKIGIALAQNAVHTAAQEFLDLVDRHNHTDVRHITFLSEGT